MRKLTDEEIAEIAKMRALGFSQKDIAVKLNISQTAVSYQLRKLWRLAVEKGVDRAFTELMIKTLPKEERLILDMMEALK